MENYIVIKEIGKGSFGTAMLCERKKDRNKCVIKLISLRKMVPKEVEKTLLEAKLLGKLLHPNIVSLYESFLDRVEQKLAIVMEYADKGDLEAFIKEKRGKFITESEVLDIFVQMSLAIKHIHDRKILHRDLKSQNVFLTSAGTVKVNYYSVLNLIIMY